LIYENLEKLKKFEPKYRLKRTGLGYWGNSPDLECEMAGSGRSKMTGGEWACCGANMGNIGASNTDLVNFLSPLGKPCIIDFTFSSRLNLLESINPDEDGADLE
jgi:hypothetical protein